MTIHDSIETDRTIECGGTFRNLLLALFMLLVATASVASESRLEDGLPVRPANAETVFDHVLVFPADADDQAIESWRQRAFDRVKAACVEPGGCAVRMIRFHVAARWQLPMVGIAVVGKTRPLDAALETSSNASLDPVWIANTSVSWVRQQVAAIATR